MPNKRQGRASPGYRTRQKKHGGGGFHSEEQRKYMWAVVPKAAKKWAHNRDTTEADWIKTGRGRVGVPGTRTGLHAVTRNKGTAPASVRAVTKTPMGPHTGTRGKHGMGPDIRKNARKSTSRTKGTMPGASTYIRKGKQQGQKKKKKKSLIRRVLL